MHRGQRGLNAFLPLWQCAWCLAYSFAVRALRVSDACVRPTRLLPAGRENSHWVAGFAEAARCCLYGRLGQSDLPAPAGCRYPAIGVMLTTLKITRRFPLVHRRRLVRE